MEAGLSVEDAGRIRVVVAAVGGDIAAAELREYVALVTNHDQVQLSSVSSYYKELQKSPFARLPWDRGCLRFKFVLGRSVRSQWEDFQAHRRVHGVIAICHCPSTPDLEDAYERFVDMANEYPSAQTRRLFAFRPSDEQARLDEAEKKRPNLILFPPADPQTLGHHMQTLMHDFAASLLMSFESRVVLAEQMGALLTTPLDSNASLVSEDVSKSKRRRLERVQKIMADYCLLAGSTLDAISHYSTAIELSRHTGDTFWNAGALEGIISTTILNPDPETAVHSADEDMRYRFYEAIQLYRRSSAAFFEVEAALKLARFLCRGALGKHTAREVAELLTGAVEVGKGLSDKDDCLVLFVEVARIFGTIGYERKSAFFTRQVAQMYHAQNSPKAAKSALQILLLAASCYGVGKKKATYKCADDTLEAGAAEDEQPVHWNALQISVLGDILAVAVRAGDPLMAWTAGARLLRYHYPYITPSAQASLVAALFSASERLPSGTRSSEAALPFVRLLSLPALPSGTNIIRKVPGKKDWWAESNSAEGPFIYAPVTARNGDSKDSTVTWVVDECVEVSVEVANPCAFEVLVQELRLSVEGPAFDAFPLSVSLPPNTSQVLSLLGVPRQAGSVTIRGCFATFTGITTEHLFEDVENLLVQAAKGTALVDPFRGGEKRSSCVPRPRIVITSALPLLAAAVVGGSGDVVLYEGEIRQVHISLSNAGSLPVTEACLSLSGKQREHVVTIDHTSLQSALPLQPGATVLIPVELRAGKANNNEDKRSHPLVLLHYAGQDETSLIGRQLALPLQLHVQKGLSLVQARLLSTDVPAQVTARLLNPSNGEGLLKADPYRGGWSCRLLEMELWNPTDIPFEISVSYEETRQQQQQQQHESGGLVCPVTRIDSKYSSRVMVPLSVIEKLFSEQIPWDEAGSVEELSSRIRLCWRSERSNVGEMQVAEAIKCALQASMAELLTSNPLTFGFRLKNEEQQQQQQQQVIVAHELTALDMLVKNNTNENIKLVLGIRCCDAAGEPSTADGSAVLWAGVLSNIEVTIPALGQYVHSFALCFMLPGDYTLSGAASEVERPARNYCGPAFTLQVEA